MCLEAVKIYGNNPRKLFTTMNINKEINIIDPPLEEKGPKRVLNSLWSFSNPMLSIITILVGVAQNKGVKMVIKMTALIQFNGIKIVEEGSNTENKLVIIIFN